MTPEQLKASILQYAIQGKLTYHKTDDDAIELIRALQKAKVELVKNKVIKKEKPLPDMSEDDIPFNIPDNWKWCYCQDVFFAHSAMRIHQSDWKPEGIPFFRGRELVRLAKTGDPNAEIYITEELYNELKEKGGVPKKDDILITAVGTLGKVYVVQGTKRFYYKDAYILCLDNYGVNPYYIKYLVESPYCQNYIYGDDAYGTTVAQLTLEKLKKLIIPMPPLEEQHRIVAKIEELLPYVDRYAEAYEKLKQFNAKFPEDMKKSILQYAIQGKLVEQRPEEGTAEELYQQIQDEKQKLIKEGKTKKEKPLAEITEDEIPFDIPDSWKWVRFNELCAVLTCGYASTPTYVSEEVGMPFISAKNVKPYKFMPDDHKFIGKDLYEQLTANTKPSRGDILLTRVGAGIGEAAIIDVDMDFAIYVSLTLIKLVDNELVNNRYILHWLNSPLGTATAQKNIFGKGASQGNLNVKNVRDFIVPLPPYKEQVRIADKLDKVLPYCDKLK